MLEIESHKWKQKKKKKKMIINESLGIPVSVTEINLYGPH